MEVNASVVFVFLEVFSHEGGIQTHIQDILSTYHELGAPPAKVFVLRDGLDDPNPFSSKRLSWEFFKTSNLMLGRMNLSSTLFYYLRKHRPRHVFCGHTNLAPPIWLMCKLLRIPYTVLTYGKEVWKPLPLVYRWALQQADQVWTISRYTRDRLCSVHRVQPHKVQLLPCMVKGDRYTPGEKSATLLQHYGLSNGLSNSRVLMTVARLWIGDPYKGVDITIRALPTILQVCPDVKYLVVGRGNDMPRLVKLAMDLGVRDRVIFAGFVPTETLVEHYRLADVYVMPSQEGFGIAYLEAMACGVPVLAGDADGSAEPLMDGRLGWQVPHRNPDAVAAACIDILGRIAQHRQHDQTHPNTPPPELRCDGGWLRQEAIANFGEAAFQQRLQQLLQHAIQPHQ
ncbi:glycosyltransferase family 4 protein [Leptolyngbya sp. AN02str]|uniref:glycosyltransferase family 4 protein n=1 Tax=Leptolyngbya sp. AN02str TaxID=3423363 RepID=UPI003D31161F